MSLQNKLKNIFEKRYTFLCVIHVIDKFQAVEQSKIAIKNGADGIFLINHSISYRELLKAYFWVRNFLNDVWIGVNFLDLCAKDVFAIIPMGADGVWVDNIGINEHSEVQEEAELVKHNREISGWNGILFGGVAFKYQKKVINLKKVTEEATKYADFITTSGDFTGYPPAKEKISEMAKYIGNKKLAIASGMTIDNVLFYKESHCFLVATGISKSMYELDPILVKKFAEQIQKMNAT